MSVAAQQEETIEQLDFAPLDFAATGTESVGGLRQVASERLAAHRNRRAAAAAFDRAVEAEAQQRPRSARAGASAASRVRDAVAARYQNSVSYREFLAQETERALQRAEAEMRESLANAMADIAVAREFMEQQPLLPAAPMGMSQIEAVAASPSGNHAGGSALGSNVYSTGLTVRLYEDLSVGRQQAQSKGERRVMPQMDADVHEARALDAEIDFRRAPEFEPHHPEPVGIAGNLIEFPRQLVAARKARPRLAEGPLREESAPEPQLRIFEVEPEQISAAPAEVASAPEWQSIMLDGAPATVTAAHAEPVSHFTIQPQIAPLELRLMAAMVDACCVGAALIGFVAVAAEVGGSRLGALPLPMLGAMVVAVSCALFVMYQFLFFTFGEATLGMRYARIGLCTFGDSNPTRAAMRRRVFATLLAACPLGLGLAWAWMDEDRLGWHDRISRMYQRAY